MPHPARLPCRDRLVRRRGVLYVIALILLAATGATHSTPAAAALPSALPVPGGIALSARARRTIGRDTSRAPSR